MNNSSRRIAKAKSIDAMRKILRCFVKQSADVYVSLWKMKTFPASYVKISSYLIQRQSALSD